MFVSLFLLVSNNFSSNVDLPILIFFSGIFISLQILRMLTNWPVLLSMAVFYLIVLLTGIWASRKARQEEKRCTGNRSEVTMVGGRNLNVVVSVFTLAGTK